MRSPSRTYVLAASLAHAHAATHQCVASNQSEEAVLTHRAGCRPHVTEGRAQRGLSCVRVHVHTLARSPVFHRLARAFRSCTRGYRHIQALASGHALPQRIAHVPHREHVLHQVCARARTMKTCPHMHARTHTHNHAHTHAQRVLHSPERRVLPRRRVLPSGHGMLQHERVLRVSAAMCTQKTISPILCEMTL